MNLTCRKLRTEASSQRCRSPSLASCEAESEGSESELSRTITSGSEIVQPAALPLPRFSAISNGKERENRSVGRLREAEGIEGDRHWANKGETTVEGFEESFCGDRDGKQREMEGEGGREE